MSKTLEARILAFHVAERARQDGVAVTDDYIAAEIAALRAPGSTRPSNDPVRRAARICPDVAAVRRARATLIRRNPVAAKLLRDGRPSTRDDSSNSREAFEYGPLLIEPLNDESGYRLISIAYEIEIGTARLDEGPGWVLSTTDGCFLDASEAHWAAEFLNDQNSTIPEERP